MSMLKTAPSPKVDLVRSLGDDGEKEYRALLRMVRASRDFFALMPVESDFRPALRDALLERLRADLAEMGLQLYVVRLSRDVWGILDCLDVEEVAQSLGVVVVVGLENTPEIVPEPGAPSRRPPAMAWLNVSRETLRKKIPAPLLLWCDPLSYTALQEHAPDFFDHFTALFTFLDAAPPPPTPIEPLYGLLSDEELTRTVQQKVASSKVAVTFYEEQVKRLSEPDTRRARALLGLTEALLALHDGDIVTRLSRAEALTREALMLLSPKKNKTEWARGQGTLGNVLSQLPSGKRSKNLRQAIDCYNQALQVYTEADFPQAWAITQQNLGTVYRSLPTGDRNENLQQSIACYQAALRVRSETEFPIEWAGTQNNLGVAYRYLSSGNRDENLRHAIACYLAALRVYTEAKFPYEWAGLQNNLGAVYAILPTGDRNENLQQAIACYQAALRVRSETEFPIDWAATQNNLGLAYQELLAGDHNDNLHKAIGCHMSTLRVYDTARFPYEWAMTQNNLGNAYLELTTGDRKEILKQALSYYQNALQIFDNGDFTRERAGTLFNMGRVFAEAAGRSGDAAIMGMARDYFTNAAQSFSSVGLNEDAENAMDMIRQMDEWLRDHRSITAGVE